MREFAEKLLIWYANNKRPMPWRDVKDPYKVWVSEVMLQQTRVDTVIAYYQRWMDRFPSLSSLAMATQEDVLRLWEGLGYYTRARKLHEAAKVVMNEHAGVIPTDPVALRTLPGVGPYTAAAIASFAFNADTFPVDGNINRVFARVFGIQTQLGSMEFARSIEEKRSEVFPVGRSSDFNQAIMDLGATICKPVSPVCPKCPLNSLCVSKSAPERLPNKPLKKTVPTVAKLGLAMTCNKQTLVFQREERGLLGGLWEFPSIELDGEGALEEGFAKFTQKFGKLYSNGEFLVEIKHVYTHFKVLERVWIYRIERPPENTSGGRWVAISELETLPMGKIDRAIADRLSEI